VLDVTALTTLSQRWNTLSWLAGVVVVLLIQVMVVEAVVRVEFYLLLDTL
jgi:hypothetical protein